jgi:glycosyltransferase involved in cell wall biosynthesis
LKNLRIALLTDGISPIVTGGMQKHSFYLAKFLAKNKVNVDLYHCVKSSEPYDLEKIFSKDELEYINELTFSFPIRGFLPFQYIRNSFRYSVDLLLRYKKLEEADFIYAQGFTAWAFFNEKKKGRIKAPIGVNFHGLEMFQHAEGWKSKLTQYFFKNPVQYNLRNADYSYSLGGKLTDILRKFCSEDHIKEISIGLDSEWVRKSEIPKRAKSGMTRFVFIGRYERRKGIEELNRVIERINDDRFHIDFIGPVPADKQLSDDNVAYHGLIKEEDKLQSILDEADVLICPSWAEGMPTVILEAMSRGLAIIATDVGAVSIEVGKENGWLIEPGDEKGLEVAVREALDSSDETLLLKKRMSLNKIERNFLWTRVIDKTITHFKESITE